MHTPEIVPPLSEFLGDADLYDVLENRLVPWKINPRWTELYLVDGLPEVVVRRHNLGHYQNGVSDAYASARVFNALNQHDIHTVPHAVVDDIDNAYFITHKVHGVELSKVLTPSSSSSLYTMLDERWAQLANYTRMSMLKERPYAPDILTPNQYMFGRTKLETEDTIQLVDIGFQPDTYDCLPAIFNYESSTLTLAGTIVHMEKLLGERPLTAARLATLAAVHATADMQAHPDAKCRRSYARAAVYVLDNSTDISDIDEENFAARFADEP